MDKTALYKLNYGVFMLSTKAGDKTNGCITNTCMQVATSPNRVAISVINANYTCDLIKESGVFAVSVIDNTVTFETISYFGHQSGRNVDKMGPLPLPEDVNGVPYLNWSVCALLSCRVVSSQDLGSHTLFIGELVDARVLSDNEPLAYSDYQNKLKPKPKDEPAKDRKIIGWKCKICQYFYEGETLPDDYECPVCGHGKDDFEPVYA
ncbi:MAG: flavin reductase [Oscillospiraceae bacterium]|nr:flavin reductase [Oscillospiraceae bacterium]